MSQVQNRRDYTVVGMTCQHCALSVTEEVSELAGVENVDVDLASGRLTVEGDAVEQAIRDALIEAGYKVSP